MVLQNLSCIVVLDVPYTMKLLILLQQLFKNVFNNLIKATNNEDFSKEQKFVTEF